MRAPRLSVPDTGNDLHLLSSPPSLAWRPGTTAASGPSVLLLLLGPLWVELLLLAGTSPRGGVGSALSLLGLGRNGLLRASVSLRLENDGGADSPVGRLLAQ